MGDNIAAKVEHQRPTISVPPRSSFESFLSGGSFPGFSTGPMTLISSFFSDPDNCSFSQLLAGAMASPITKPNSFSFFVDDNSATSCIGGDKVSGYKQNRPVGLVVAQSPLFMVPPGLSPSGFLNSPGFLSPLQSPFGMSHQQALAHVTAQAALSQSHMQLQTDFQQLVAAPPAEALQDQSCSLAAENIHSNGVGMVPESETVKTESPEFSQSGGKTVVASVEKLECDGFNWRKYGQKQVKASEFPRSYYKCSHVGCAVKKKVERSRDGHVTEITYKGQHNHDPPQLNKRAKDGSGPVGTSSSHVNPRQSSQDQTSNITYTPEDGQLSCQPSSHQHPVTREHNGSEDNTMPVHEEDDNDQANAKRRCIEEAGACGRTSAHKTVTESRIIVQTRSEVDLLDDGYKWRKYGQKVVKGNPYPRSYYRCTHAGCNVRKHVERASADPKNVITTYEGKHNHVIPAAKNSGGNNAFKSSNLVQFKSQNMKAGKPILHTEMDSESKDHVSILPRVKEREIAA